jgi:hypothetical protein
MSRHDNPALWKKGQSGNPGGRVRGIERVVREEIASLVETITDPETKRQAILDGWQRMARKLFDLAIEGSVPAAKLLLERAFGYPKQTMDMTVAGSALDRSDVAKLSDEELIELAAAGDHTAIGQE